MNTHQERTLQAFRRMQGWLGARPELATGSTAAAGPALAQQIAAMRVVVQQFTSHAAQQEAAGRAGKGSTAEARDLRRELITHHLRPVADIAKAAIPDVVRTTEVLRLPSGKLSTEALLATAEAMATAGEQHKLKLVEHGLPEDFVKQIKDVAAALKQAIDTRGQQTAVRRGAAEGIDAAIEQGRKLVLSLSVIINKRLRNDPVALAEWNQLKRVTLRGTRASTVPAPTPAPTPTPTVAPAAVATPTQTPAAVVTPAAQPKAA